MTDSAQEAHARKLAVAGIFDRGADEYDRIGEFFTPIGLDLVAAAGITSGERVLDVGCGRGAVLFAAAEAVGATGWVTGIDLAERMVLLTAGDAAARGIDNVTVTAGDAEQPDLPAGSFDAVLASFVLFLLPDPAAALVRYGDLLRPHGRLGFTTFGSPDLAFEAAMTSLGSFVTDGLPQRGGRQGPFGSVDGITALLASAGFAAPTITERTYETRFRDPDEWLAWAWSHGGRATLERIPAEHLDEASAAAKVAFEQARTPEGDYAIRTTIRFTIARPAAR
jgi:ubiquinone/menaquinone biosynthesis C-methylase UbiE